MRDSTGGILGEGRNVTLFEDLCVDVDADARAVPAGGPGTRLRGLEGASRT